MPPKNSKLLSRARELRQNMTPQERKLWYLFLQRHSAKFYRQRIIASFIVDFYCDAAKLVIEVDGSQHYEPQGIAYDTERTAILAGHGLKVLRFSNAEINTHFPAVCQQIDQAVRSRAPLLFLQNPL